MDFQILIQGEPIISQDFASLALMAIIIVCLLLIIILLLWRKVLVYEKSKYEFLTIITHKLRTPLTQIKWITEGILEREQDPYKSEGLRNIDQANNNLISLTATLIELTDSAHTSLTVYKFEKVNVCEMAHKVIDDLKRDLHEKNHFVGIECADPNILIKTDRSRMEFVLQTLLENAVRYSPPGRNVDVIISVTKRKVFISVKDDGIGISHADMARIFSKFFRAKNAKAVDTEGFGVALYLAQSIVNRHGGKIEVFSDGYNKGSTFTVVLPLAH